MSIHEIVEKYLEGTQLSIREFSGELANSLKCGSSHVTIMNWRDGKTEPPTDWLLQCLLAYTDWRRHFAYECLQAKLPEVFGNGELAAVLAQLSNGRK